MVLNSVYIGFLGLGGSEILLLFLLASLMIIPTIFYMLTLQNTLNAVSPENQKMPPGQVWLSLIPLFGTVWQFIIVNRIADSLKAEFAKRAIHVQEDRPGAALGITYCVLNCCSVIPFLGVLTALGGLVCWIIYWVKISNYKALLQQHAAGQVTAF